MVGYIALIEGSGHVYDLLFEPKNFHCALVAQLAGVEGSGKQAIYNALRYFLDEFLTVAPVPSIKPDEKLAYWHARVMAKWEQDREREKQLIVTFSSILNGEQPSTAERQQFPAVLIGPWASPETLPEELRVLQQDIHAPRTALPRTSMADPAFVESLVRRMVEDARAVAHSPEHDRALSAIIAMWATEFSPENPAYAQKWSLAEALSIFLRLRGYGQGTPAEDFDAPVKALLSATIKLCLRADQALRNGEIHSDQALFWVDAAVEDCQCFLRGFENRAD
jgi:hypothetical protein